MPLDLTDNKSTLVQVMAWCRQATSHYLSQCWPRSMSPNGVTGPQWVNFLNKMDSCYPVVHLTVGWVLDLNFEVAWMKTPSKNLVVRSCWCLSLPLMWTWSWYKLMWHFDHLVWHRARLWFLYCQRTEYTTTLHQVTELLLGTIKVT